MRTRFQTRGGRTGFDTIGPRQAVAYASGRRQGFASAARLGLLLLIPLLLLGCFLWPAASDADELSEYHLAGPRPPVPISVVLLLDVSGSFQNYEGMRHQALEQIVTWADGNLRPDDTITMVAFAEDADVLMSAVEVGNLPSSGEIDFTGHVNTGDTRILPPLQAVAQELPTGPAASIITVTDTLVSDADPAVVESLMQDLNATSSSVIAPHELGVDPTWHAAFPWEAHFRADHSASSEIALAVGQALAHATGQTLEKGPKSDG